MEKDNTEQMRSEPMTEEQIKAYLSRIDVPQSDRRDLGYLMDIHRQHISHIPFENLDITAGKSVSLDRQDLFSKIIIAQRGGVCSELNTLYNWFLESLGFSTVSFISRLITKTGPIQARSHRIICVSIGDERYITDVGFNFEHHRIPLKLEEGFVQSNGACQYCFTKDAFWGWVLWQQRPGQRWRRKLGFTEEPQLDVDFVAPTFFAAFHPDSKINKATKVSLHIGDDFYAVRSGKFFIEPKGAESEGEPITSKEQKEYLFREVFHLPV